MSEGRERTLLGETIQLKDDYIDIDTLKFLKDNPRVYACTHGLPDFDNLTLEEQQEEIYKKLLQEPSVKNLIPEVRRHNGLVEPILVRYDRMEVIEGNSRLAVYRKLRDEKFKGDWQLIPCEIVSSLTDEQQVAFLNEIHVKGKTQWSAYEKANFAYVRKMKGWGFDQIAELFGESSGTIRKRFNVIKMMKDNEDTDQSRFSYYDVLVRNQEIFRAIKDDDELSDLLMAKIKDLGSDDVEDRFTAQELRKKLPVILEKPKVRKKYMNRQTDLDGGYQLAKISHVEEKVRQAKTLLEDVSKQDVMQLETNRFNAFKQAVKGLSRAVVRIEGMTGPSSK